MCEFGGNNKKLCDNKDCSLCFKKSFASSSRAKCILNIDSRTVFKNSNKKYKFKCDSCSHIFVSVLNSITNGTWCPFCANQKLCDNKDCDFCFKKSFSSHPKCNYILNIEPRKIFKQSHKKYKFKCDKCEHTFDAVLYNITNGTWCPFCANQKLCDNKECDFCYNKSFASSPKAKSILNIDSRTVFKQSYKKYTFKCDVCSHTFKSVIGDITRGSWCPFCTNKKLCDNKDCSLCFNKSFASHSKNNSILDVDPRKVFKQSNKKYRFKCDVCSHKFKSVVSNITHGCWCPFCVNKTEKIVYSFLKDNYSNVIYQHVFLDLPKYRFDFYLPDDNLIIEIDGRQHFEQVSNWVSPEITYERDKIKTEYCLVNNISVIRILQEDIYYNKYDWQEILKDRIGYYLFSKLFLIGDEMYDKFKENFKQYI